MFGLGGLRGSTAYYWTLKYKTTEPSLNQIPALQKIPAMQLW